MKAIRSLLLGFLVWIGIGIAIAYRISTSSAGQSFGETFTLTLPSLILWALATPIVFRLANRLPLKNASKTLVSQLGIGALFVPVYNLAFTAVDSGLNGSIYRQGEFSRQVISNIEEYWLFTAAIWAVTTSVAYVAIAIAAGKPLDSHNEFENSILIKTKFGFVLVEIEDFQYVKGGGKRIMFNTGKTKTLDRNRVEQEKGKLVEENKYRNDRSVVIDLGKIRRADQIEPDRYIFYIGYSHELNFSHRFYQKLGGWLPRPVIRYEIPKQ